MKMKTAPCPNCGSVFHLCTQKSRGRNKKPHVRYTTCWKCRLNEKKSGQGGNTISSSQDADPFGQICAMSSESSIPPSQAYVHQQKSKPHQPNQITLTHYIFSKGEWRRDHLRNHPSTQLTITNDSSPSFTTSVHTLADSGASLMCGPLMSIYVRVFRLMNYTW